MLRPPLAVWRPGAVRESLTVMRGVASSLALGAILTVWGCDGSSTISLSEVSRDAGQATPSREAGAGADSGDGMPRDGGETVVDGDPEPDAGGPPFEEPTCGNGVLDADEQCDPAIVSGGGACPEGCTSADACLARTLAGNADDCTARCEEATITECRGGDGCCPAGCRSNSDGDCPVACGNGLVEPGESCDGNCPSGCSAPSACTTSTIEGSPSTCNARCVDASVTACVSGDGCCAAGCSHLNDMDCADPCETASKSCPGGAPGSAGGGLVPINRCAFSLSDDGSGPGRDAAIAQLAARLPHSGIDGLLGDLNREAVRVTSIPGVSRFAQGFRWNNGDRDVAYWIPQGLTTSRDSTPNGTVAGRHVGLVSWYYEKSLESGSTIEKGVRIAVVDLSASPPKYRLALLVDPVGGATPSFKAVNVHAGGVAWYGDRLFVADTKQGLRVFDLSRILRVDPNGTGIGHRNARFEAAGYKYVVPQVGMYQTGTACSPRYSFVATDLSTSPPSLVTGEYCASSVCSSALAGRVMRWPLHPSAGALLRPRTFASEAFYMSEKQVQGAVSNGGTWYLSSSAPASAGGALYTIPPGGRRSSGSWVDGPEDLSFDVGARRLWGLSEHVGKRFVFSVDK